MSGVVVRENIELLWMRSRCKQTFMCDTKIKMFLIHRYVLIAFVIHFRKWVKSFKEIRLIVAPIAFLAIAFDVMG